MTNFPGHLNLLKGYIIDKIKENQSRALYFLIHIKVRETQRNEDNRMKTDFMNKK